MESLRRVEYIGVFQRRNSSIILGTSNMERRRIELNIAEEDVTDASQDHTTPHSMIKGKKYRKLLKRRILMSKKNS